jgi:hypothetical protein
MPKIKSDYLEASNGTIMDIPCPGQFHLACCSCGLDHLLLFNPGKKGFVQITVYRDDHMTEAHRKQNKFDCRPKR